MDDQLLNEFLAGAEEIIEGLHADLASLRARRGEGRARRELVGRIFRQVHTVKGTASSAGLEAASRLAHAFEAAARGASLPVPQRLVERMQSLTAANSNAENSGGERGDADEFARLPREVVRALGEYERQRLREAAREGA